jgi:hypothetical protein
VRADHFHDAAILLLRESAAAILRRHAHPQHADLSEPAHDFVGNARLPVDARSVDVIATISADLVHGLSRRTLELGRQGRIRKDRFRPEAAEKQILGEARLLRPRKKQLFGLFDLLATQFGFSNGHSTSPHSIRDGIGG